MQILIDTATDDAATIRKAIRMLEVYVGDSDTLLRPEALTPPAKIEAKVLPFAKPTSESAAATANTPANKSSEPLPQPMQSSAAPTAPQNPAPPPPPPLVKIPDPPTSASNASPPSLPSSTSQTATATSTGPVEYDSAGVPWDARIHQKTKGVKKDRTWKLLKGIDQNIVQGVIAELSANGKLKPVMAEAPPPPVTAQAPATTAASSTAASVFGKSPLPAGAEAPPPPAAAPVNNAPPPPPPSDAQPGTAFRTLVARFAGATKAGHMTPQQLNALCQANGAPNIMALNSMEHLIPAVNTALDGELLSRGVTL